MWLKNNTGKKKKITRKSMTVYDRKKPKETQQKQKPKSGSGRQIEIMMPRF